MAHLDHCEACRENVRQLTLTGEGLLGLLPSVEPPAGFETRVMDRIGLAAPPPRPSPGRWLGLAVPAAAAAGQPRWSEAASQPQHGRRPGGCWPSRPSRWRVVAGGLGGWGLQ